METATISKNEASPKSHTSRGNFFRYIFALLIVSILFVGCKKDDEGSGGSDSSGNTGIETLTIDGKIGNVNYGGQVITPDNITKVGVYRSKNDSRSDRNAITGTTVANRQFSLNLLTPPADVLITVKSMLEGLFDDKSLVNQLTISNSSAKIYAPEFYALWTNGSEIIYNMKVSYSKESDYYYEETYYYVDSDVSVTGTLLYELYDWEYKTVFNLNLKKGWNVIGIEETDSSTTTENYKNATMRNDITWMNP